MVTKNIIFGKKILKFLSFNKRCVTVGNDGERWETMGYGGKRWRTVRDDDGQSVTMGNDGKTIVDKKITTSHSYAMITVIRSKIDFL